MQKLLIQLETERNLNIFLSRKNKTPSETRCFFSQNKWKWSMAFFCSWKNCRSCKNYCYCSKLQAIWTFVLSRKNTKPEEARCFFSSHNNTTWQRINLDCDLLNSETFFYNEKTPNQTRPDVFSRTINTTCKCMKLDCDLWIFKLDFFLWSGQTSETFLLGEKKMEMVDGILLFVKKTGRDVFSIVLKLLLQLKIASNLSILFLSRTNTKPKSLMFFFFVQ